MYLFEGQGIVVPGMSYSVSPIGIVITYLDGGSAVGMLYRPPNHHDGAMLMMLHRKSPDHFRQYCLDVVRKAAADGRQHAEPGSIYLRVGRSQLFCKPYTSTGNSQRRGAQGGAPFDFSQCVEDRRSDLGDTSVRNSTAPLSPDQSARPDPPLTRPLDDRGDTLTLLTELFGTSLHRDTRQPRR